MQSPPSLPPPVATTCPPPPARADGEDGAAASAGPSSSALMSELSLLSPRSSSTSSPQLEQLVASTRRCHLTPAAFMVSWQGVLTLAYRGFPPALVDLKERIEQAHPCLPKESPGSKWPKTTLAALKDGKRLTPKQLDALNELCSRESSAFHYEGDRASLAVTHASVVVFACRSLERVVAARDVALDARTPEDDSPPDAAAAAAAAKVLAEPQAPDYWIQAAADGNRESHYRKDHIGVTLVFRHRRRDLSLASEAAVKATRAAKAAKKSKSEKPEEAYEGAIGLARLGAICDDFQQRVEAALPGMYAWFDPRSRHVTLRGICG